MKYEQMARECAAQLKPFDKTIKDATAFYIRHLKRKKSTGRKKGSGAFSSITPHMGWQDVRKRMGGMPERAQFNAKVIELLEIACESSNHALNDAELLERRIDDQARLTPAQRAERMRKRDAPAKAYEQYIDTPEGRAEQDTKKRLISFLNKYPQYKWNPFNPAGKVTNATASHIYEALEKRELPNGHLLVEGWQFASKDRVMDAIHDVARQLRCSLKKQARKH